ncbi:MAG TPA: hypothetical protein VHD15_17930 [Hyphomicrobiales bacterium]|nr:hypothetical protein [Hyphomicrobiales bacterium]
MSETTTTLVAPDGHAVGIVVHAGWGFRFHATDPRLRTIDGKPFATLEAAQRAVWGLPATPASHPPRPGLAVPSLTPF